MKIGEKSKALIILLGASMLGHAHAYSYEAKEIGFIAAGYATAILDINSSGQVVGTIFGSGYREISFITNPNGSGITELSTLGDRFTNATGVNDIGQVVGQSNSRPFITGVNGGGIRYLFPGDITENATVSAINSNGQATGQIYGKAFITDANGSATIIVGPAGNAISIGKAINSIGQVAGTSYLPTANSFSSFITGPNGVGVSNLPTVSGKSISVAGLNNLGVVVGDAFVSDHGTPSWHAYIALPDNPTPKDIGSLGGAGSNANDINSDGQVVGKSLVLTSSGYMAYHAFVTGSNGDGIMDLNDLVMPPYTASQGDDYLSQAVGINDRGQIVAVSNYNIAYILTPSPVDEPQGLIIALMGLALLAARNYKESVQHVL
jgi:probable HAF family extracellular repeat protein